MSDDTWCSEHCCGKPCSYCEIAYVRAERDQNDDDYEILLKFTRVELARVTERLRVAREALEDISSKLDCASPCGPTRITCRKCGDTEEDWCAGCVARAALAATADGAE